MIAAGTKSTWLVAAFAVVFLAPAARAETIAVIHAKAYTVAADTPVDDATIVFADGKIVSVKAGAAAPAGAKVIDAAGRIVTPGFMSGATQLGLVEVNAAAETNDQSVSKGPLGAAFDVQYALNANSVLLPVARADGVTRAMVYPSSAVTAPFSGMGALIRLSEGPDLAERVKAAMFVAVGAATIDSGGGSRSAQWVLLRNALDEARQFMNASRNAGPRDQLLNRPDVLALAGMFNNRMPLVIAAQRESDIRQAIKLQDDYDLRVVIFGGTEAWRAADELARAKIGVILNPMANLPWTFDEIGGRLDNAALLAKAGVVVAFVVPGNTIHLSHNAGLALREGAGLAVANGLSYAEALKAVTVNPARLWGIADHYGTLSPGQDADVVIWDGDPLEPSSAPTAVFIAGRAVSLVTRQIELRDRYAPARRNDPWPPAYR